jgi:hypothetical protein
MDDAAVLVAQRLDFRIDFLNLDAIATWDLAEQAAAAVPLVYVASVKKTRSPCTMGVGMTAVVLPMA